MDLCLMLYLLLFHHCSQQVLADATLLFSSDPRSFQERRPSDQQRQRVTSDRWVSRTACALLVVPPWGHRNLTV
jgi:hypothetical protein